MVRCELKRFFTIILITVLCVFTCFPTMFSQAYVLHEDGIWLGTEIRYLPHEDFGDLSVSHMNEALYVWNSAMDAGYLGRYADDTHSDKDYPLYDNENKVYRVPLGRNGTVAENTVFSLKSNHMVVESDININMSYSLANSAQPDKYDVWSVFLHEAGHTVGIADNMDVPASVMYAVSSKNAEKRSLHSDDLAAIQAIYG